MAETNPFIRHRTTSRENLSQSSHTFDAQNPFADNPNTFIPFNVESSTSDPSRNSLAPPQSPLHGSSTHPPHLPSRRSLAPILTLSPDQEDETTLIAKVLLLEHQKAREQELLDEALARRLQLEEGDDPVPPPSNRASLDQQIAQQLADEELARQIQEEEDLSVRSMSRGSSIRRGPSIRTTSPETNADEILARSLADEDYAHSLAEADEEEVSQQRRPSGTAVNGYASSPPPVGTSSPYPPYRPPAPPASGYPPYRPLVGYSPNSFAPQQPGPPWPPPNTAPRFNYFPTTSSQPSPSQTPTLPPRGPRPSPGSSPSSQTEGEILARELADQNYARAVARPPPPPPAVPSRPQQQELDEAPPAYEAVPTEGTTLPVPAALLPPSSDASGSTTVSIGERFPQEQRDAEMARRLAAIESSEPTPNHFPSMSRLGPPVPPKIKRLVFTKYCRALPIYGCLTLIFVSIQIDRSFHRDFYSRGCCHVHGPIPPVPSRLASHSSPRERVLVHGRKGARRNPRLPNHGRPLPQLHHRCQTRHRDPARAPQVRAHRPRARVQVADLGDAAADRGMVSCRTCCCWNERGDLLAADAGEDGLGGVYERHWGAGL
ncbi:hypothetical protein BJ742DRAFT_332580 [Cladochytrium replicatum]|nr:hypothetical protein BJ742DRAFT_332580 [Cladochytrium replicatum]